MTLITRITGFIAFMALPQILGYASGSHVRKYSKTYYPELKKPFWAPPPALLRTIWPILYLLQGIASYLVWRQKILNNTNVKVQIILYCIQLFFNVNFCPLFFRVKSPLLALFDLFLTLTFAAFATLTYLPVSSTAAFLMLPYLGFLVISGYLCKRVWRLNQGRNLDAVINQASERPVTVQ
ncbi:TspO/MBR-related protein [Neoconidiobolus thromboides FSU 785]|nr:TspO/MBR-related protein [Neoconidiobolus thromboides FSU 785]